MVANDAVQQSQQLIKALGHPLRRRIIEAAIAAEGEALSPATLSRQLDAQVSLVAYHVKQLVAAGLLKPAGQRPVRGAVEHYYEPVPGLEEAVRHLEEAVAALEHAAKGGRRGRGRTRSGKTSQSASYTAR